jgi:hypothetical protein
MIIKEHEQKIEKVTEDISKKFNDLFQKLLTLEKKVDAEKARSTQECGAIDVKLKEISSAITKTAEALIGKSKEECLNKITSCCNDIKTLEKKVECNTSSKGMSDTKEINEKLKQAQEEMKKSVDFLVSKCKEEFNVKVTLAETKTQKIKEDLLAKTDLNTRETKSLGCFFVFAVVCLTFNIYKLLLGDYFCKSNIIFTIKHKVLPYGIIT